MTKPQLEKEIELLKTENGKKRGTIERFKEEDTRLREEFSKVLGEEYSFTLTGYHCTTKESNPLSWEQIFSKIGELISQDDISEMQKEVKILKEQIVEIQMILRPKDNDNRRDGLPY